MISFDTLAFMRNILLSIGMLAPIQGAASTPGAVMAETQLQELLDQQRELGCQDIQSTLQSVLCSKELRIGVLTDYKGFADKIDKMHVGFEIDFANYISTQLGVKPVLIPTTVSRRIQKLVDKEMDLLLAALSHTSAREQAVHFVRPHYFSSATAIIGLKETLITDLTDLNDVTLCVPLGSYDNIRFDKAHARLLTFDTAQKMVDALKFGACDLLAHDRSLTLLEVTGPMAPQFLRGRYEEKFSIDETPWGTAVRNEDSATLGRAISLITAKAHSRGVIERLALINGTWVPMLAVERKRFESTNCFFDNGLISPDCLIQARDIGDTPSAISPTVTRFQSWTKETLGLKISLPMLSGQQGLKLFLKAIGTSLLLALGVIIATIIIGLGFYFLSKSNWALVRVPSQTLRVIILNTPDMLLLVLAYLVMSSLWLYTTPITIITGILAVGSTNGAAAGDSLVHASKTLPDKAPLSAVARVCAIQFRACIINATKASPLAAFIGAPDLLSVLTDITSHSGERTVTFIVLALFYVIMVQTVILLSAYLVKRMHVPTPGTERA